MRGLLVLLFTFLITYGTCQTLTVENSIFWEVTKPGVAHSSFLFGTFHGLGDTYVDSLANVATKFDQCTMFVSEVEFDSTMIISMLKASTMRDTTLDILLPPAYYSKTDEWLRSISPYELSLFNTFCPMALHGLFINLLQTNLYGAATPMDIYMEKKAKKSGKKTIGLETLEDQLDALFGMSYRRQAELLMDFVDNRELAEDHLVLLNFLYRNQNLSAMEDMTSDFYSENEMDRLLHRRNNKWMQIIPGIIEGYPSFVAVGALHLAGEEGLVNQLRKLGFNVTPISVH